MRPVWAALFLVLAIIALPALFVLLFGSSVSLAAILPIGLIPPLPLLIGLIFLWLALAVVLTRWDRQPDSPRGVLLAALIVAAVWYFAWYDQPVARCSRGDLGACVVVTQR